MNPSWGNTQRLYSASRNERREGRRPWTTERRSLSSMTTPSVRGRQSTRLHRGGGAPCLVPGRRALRHEAVDYNFRLNSFFVGDNAREPVNSGQATPESIGSAFYTGIGGSADFMRAGWPGVLIRRSDYFPLWAPHPLMLQCHMLTSLTATSMQQEMPSLLSR